MPCDQTQYFGKVIDFHVHVYPDNVAQRAIENVYSANNLMPAYDGTIVGLLDMLEKDGVRLAVIAPIATKSSQVESINDWAASHTDSRIISFGGIHPGYKDVDGQIEKIISSGLPGIKIHSNWQDTYVDDPKMFPIYEAAQGRLILTLHAGNESTPFEIQRATPDRILRVHQNFPNLTINAAHMGGYLMWDLAEEYLVGKDIYFDTSACFGRGISKEQAFRIIRRHGAEHILFGTDAPLDRPSAIIRHLMELGLTDDEMELVLCKNAERLLGLSK
ncbi:MAG: amidohydrolase family protein [Armatimonadota bacterium]